MKSAFVRMRTGAIEAKKAAIAWTPPIRKSSRSIDKLLEILEYSNYNIGDDVATENR